MGTSAGCNMTGMTISTTNDMPIIYPPTFKAFGWVPFNINPHYLDPISDSTHMGESRETRISEFHKFNDTPLLRRELISRKMLSRTDDGSIYWKNKINAI